MLDKTYDPKSYEQRLYEKTEPFFACKNDGERETYTIMMPPPNVTGSLHLGHALNDTLQDILTRYFRKKGKDVLWQPGTDHAGIATQIVVERQLAEQGISRHDLGRDAFIDKVWEWKEKSGNTILHQKRRLCISPDWSRQRFTMDEGLSKAVVQVFVRLYNDGLIYRAKRLVNWDTSLQTAISDLEVEQREQSGSMWHINYPVDGTDDFITVATTRPETFFGDSAVAVHPEDERYKHLVGKYVRLPIVDRLIPIIADEYCDMEKGTGAVKITPGHDMNDFQVGQRHQLPMINIMDANGMTIAPVPDEYCGLTFANARKKVLAVFEESGVLVKTETIKNTVPYSERSNVEIQPWLTDQWFIDAEKMAAPALKAVEDGRTQFFPKNWENTYFDWMKNIQPWCISRQIWWGHQIPAWHAQDGTIFVAESEADAFAQASKHFGNDVSLTRDTDVLDTWFSSALWPFTTLGWPEQTDALKRYYPTDILTTGFDIIFFWVARMMMMGLHFMGDVPFKTVYIHALVRDEKGQKMSKSKGNIIDPLVLIDKFGADAVRFTLAQLATPGRDIKIGESRVEQSRNFLTKIWNAVRFLEMNECVYDDVFDPATATHGVNQWIIAQTLNVMSDVGREIEGYRFDLATQCIYQFFWDTFCGVYVECLKSLLSDEKSADETRKTAMWVLVQFLNMINPIMPMISEHLWEVFVGKDTLIAQVWGASDLSGNIQFDTKSIAWAIAFVDEVRSLKGMLGISGGTKLSVVVPKGHPYRALIHANFNWMSHLARMDKILDASVNGVPFVVQGETFILEMDSDFNVSEAKEILENKSKACVVEIERLSKKLTNEVFKAAKPDLWEADNELFNMRSAEKDKIEKILSAW